MTAVQTRAVTEDEADLRLDRWFRRHFPDLTQGAIQKLCRTGQIRVDGHRAEAVDPAGAGPGRARAAHAGRRRRAKPPRRTVTRPIARELERMMLHQRRPDASCSTSRPAWPPKAAPASPATWMACWTALRMDAGTGRAWCTGWTATPRA